MLDEECYLPKPLDKNFCAKVWKTYEKDKNFVIVKNKPNWFTVKHYAGAVPYCTDGFVVKNSDTLSLDCVNCLSASSNKLVADVFQKLAKDSVADSGTGGKA